MSQNDGFEKPYAPGNHEWWRPHSGHSTPLLLPPELLINSLPSSKVDKLSPTRTEMLKTIIDMGETRIAILERKAKDAKIQPGCDLGKYLTAIKELRVFLGLIHEINI